MSVITRYRSEMRWGLLGAALLAVALPATSVAQPIPLLGYAAAKVADPKRLEAFMQGLTEGATQFTFSVSRSALQKLGLSLPPDLTARVTDWFD
jgi:hypothetical protein